MITKSAKSAVENLLSLADVKIGGDREWDIEVHNPDFFKRIMASGSLALGESYMDGWWDCKALDQFFDRILSANIDAKVKNIGAVFVTAALSKLFNAQKKSRAFIIGELHYDIGNELYSAMLDRQMVYSCGYYNDANTLDEAQKAKLDLICRKIKLEPGMRILDIGCGWGALVKFAAEHYGAKAVGITVSVEQAKHAKSMCSDLPVEIRLQDYRDLNEKFDHIVSVGMFEHVGYKNYRTFMNIVNRCLIPEGIFLLHTIGGNISIRTLDPWVKKYIFPNSMLPSAEQIMKASEGIFALCDWHCFGSDYDLTLMSWYKNFTEKWDNLKGKYDQRFYRMWGYYLLSCAGAFRARKNQLWQIVFTGIDSKKEYKSIR